MFAIFLSLVATLLPPCAAYTLTRAFIEQLDDALEELYDC